MDKSAGGPRSFEEMQAERAGGQIPLADLTPLRGDSPWRRGQTSCGRGDVKGFPTGVQACWFGRGPGSNIIPQVVVAFTIVFHQNLRRKVKAGALDTNMYVTGSDNDNGEDKCNFFYRLSGTFNFAGHSDTANVTYR